MAKNKTPGDNRRAGAVKKRSQVKNPVTGNWTKRAKASGRFLDQKEDGTPFKGVRKEKKAPAAKKASAVKAAKKPAAKKSAVKVRVKGVKKTAAKKTRARK